MLITLHSKTHKRKQKKKRLFDTELLIRNQNAIISPAVQLEYKKGEMNRVQEELDGQRKNMHTNEEKWKEKEAIIDKKVSMSTIFLP